MPARAFPLILAVGALLLVAATSLFTVSEAELAIRTEFGAIVGINYTPGLHWKWPWDLVVKFDRRILSLSYTGETFLTNDNRGLIVDFYVKWRVKEYESEQEALHQSRQGVAEAKPRNANQDQHAGAISRHQLRAGHGTQDCSPADHGFKNAVSTRTCVKSSIGEHNERWKRHAREESSHRRKCHD